MGLAAGRLDVVQTLLQRKEVCRFCVPFLCPFHALQLASFDFGYRLGMHVGVCLSSGLFCFVSTECQDMVLIRRDSFSAFVVIPDSKLFVCCLC